MYYKEYFFIKPIKFKYFNTWNKFKCNYSTVVSASDLFEELVQMTVEDALSINGHRVVKSLG